MGDGRVGGKIAEAAKFQRRVAGPTGGVGSLPIGMWSGRRTM